MKSIDIKNSLIGTRSELLNSYLREISKIPILSREEEIFLAQEKRKGNKSARKKLINSNLRFVVSVAKIYQGPGSDIIDIINEGNFGLIKAVDSFDEKRGVKLISYAIYWILYSILADNARNSTGISLPVVSMTFLSLIRKKINLFEQIHEHAPSIEELAQFMDKPVKDIKNALSLPGRPLSLDFPVSEDKEFLDLCPTYECSPDNELKKEDTRYFVSSLLNQLSETNKKVLSMYYGIAPYEETSIPSIANACHLTEDRVRQIRRDSLSFLKGIILQKNRSN